MILQAKRFIEAGAYMIMIESEGIKETVRAWRTDVVVKVINELGLEKPVFVTSQTLSALPSRIAPVLVISVQDAVRPRDPPRPRISADLISSS